MTLFRRSTSKMWYLRIEVDKKVYQFSTRTTNKNDARSIEAAFRSDKIKGRAGLTSPTLNEFSKPFLDSLFGGRVAKETRRFYHFALEAAHRLPTGRLPAGSYRRGGHRTICAVAPEAEGFRHNDQSRLADITEGVAPGG